MKRRNFLKWLPVIPFGVDALRNAPKEEVKPEPPPPPVEQSPTVTIRLPKCNGSASHFAVSVAPSYWVIPGE